MHGAPVQACLGKCCWSSLHTEPCLLAPVRAQPGQRCGSHVTPQADVEVRTTVVSPTSQLTTSGLPMRGMAPHGPAAEIWDIGTWEGGIGENGDLGAFLVLGM